MSARPVRPWQIAVDLDPSGDLPLFVQIAHAVSADIRRGRLRPGDPLPGSRKLAEDLGVHRNTVLAAYRELESEGWIDSARARGTFVSRTLPEPTPRRAGQALRTGVPARPAFDLAPGPEGYFPMPRAPGLLTLPGGVPDVRLVPAASLARAYRRALARPDLLGYGDPRGLDDLRRALADMLAATRGLACGPDDLIVTRGSQMALSLVARALLRPGDIVAVEDPGYRPAWEALHLTGAKLVPIATDASGLDVDALATLLAREAVRAVYITPHHQYPTTVTLAAGRRLQLLALARAHRLAILEDDYDHEFHYEGRPVLPLASGDAAGSVVYIGTLSKVLAPGLRIGYLVAPQPLLERVVAVRSYTDLNGDRTLEAAAAELLVSGEVGRHIRRARRMYQARRDALVDALTQRLGDVLRVTPPSGGMALWARAHGVDPTAWARTAQARGVAFQVGRQFSFEQRPLPHVRLGFAGLDERGLGEAVRRMALALADLRAGKA
ncbi:MocR-like pyridoxine biosynthesis transcription factor PdxR [Nannocystis radixulma]|uniref:PLP-dependent aminotransferase family protein n=1 Tax=Nannocystis radixulma TaxID=2995305 RepID=A0ABT5B7B9_9BACT|nr:PLP-dependent aminotransferase family protein [Nannocystis radixulma]MDC0670007.1 PLP-dependent aminotransferase family protein [Nannocystis radixulma]